MFLFNDVFNRAGLMRSEAQLGTISVGPGSQSTCTKVCRIGRGPNWAQFRSAQVPSQLAPRSVELGRGPIGNNWLKAGPALNNLYCLMASDMFKDNSDNKRTFAADTSRTTLFA